MTKIEDSKKLYKNNKYYPFSRSVCSSHDVICTYVGQDYADNSRGELTNFVKLHSNNMQDCLDKHPTEVSTLVMISY
jgi:hypothetical protein